MFFPDDGIFMVAGYHKPVKNNNGNLDWLVACRSYSGPLLGTYYSLGGGGENNYFAFAASVKTK
jgi:hypothetical protein